MISVEAVISENFPTLQQRSKKLQTPILAFLRFLFHEREFKWFEENYPHLKGFDFVDQVLDYFDFSYTLNSREMQRIPVSGRVVIIANHPIGSLDGLALLKLVGDIRGDVKVVANDLLLSVKPLEKLLLPVDNMGNRTTRQNIKAIEEHLENDGAIVIFPAGEVSRMSPKGIRDGRWRNGFLRFAGKTRSPLLPVFVDARNSLFFYSLSLLAKPLSTLWLVREMFKHAKKDIRIRIGNPISFASYNNLPFDVSGKVKLLKKHVYKLSRNGGEDCFRDSLESIAHPEKRQELRQEIRGCELLGKTADNMQIYLYNFHGDSAVMREVGRLREVSFRAVGEGSGKRRDVDYYDSYYDHIILWDDERLELAGAYRLVKTAPLIAEKGISALYSHSLFEYQPSAQTYLEHGVELGRSFVQPRYWGMRSLDYLWYGIGAYLRRFPEIRYLLGPVSISNNYPETAKQLLTNFYLHHFPAPAQWAIARAGYRTAATPKNPGNNYQQAFTALKKQLGSLGVTVPTLYKQYSEICEPGGVQFVDFNIDEDFADCLDGLVMVDLNYLKASRRKRYLGG